MSSFGDIHTFKEKRKGERSKVPRMPRWEAELRIWFGHVAPFLRECQDREREGEKKKERGGERKRRQERERDCLVLCIGSWSHHGAVGLISSKGKMPTDMMGPIAGTLESSELCGQS